MAQELSKEISAPGFWFPSCKWSWNSPAFLNVYVYRRKNHNEAAPKILKNPQPIASPTNQTEVWLSHTVGQKHIITQSLLWSHLLGSLLVGFPSFFRFSWQFPKQKYNHGRMASMEKTCKQPWVGDFQGVGWLGWWLVVTWLTWRLDVPWKRMRSWNYVEQILGKKSWITECRLPFAQCFDEGENRYHYSRICSQPIPQDFGSYPSLKAAFRMVLAA